LFLVADAAGAMCRCQEGGLPSRWWTGLSSAIRIRQSRTATRTAKRAASARGGGSGRRPRLSRSSVRSRPSDEHVVERQAPVLNIEVGVLVG
jgi:hypothetical protein